MRRVLSFGRGDRQLYLVRDHQLRAGLSTVSPARTPSRLGRMDPGQHGLEPEADVRAPTAETAHPDRLKPPGRFRETLLKQSEGTFLADAILFPFDSAV